MPFSPLSVAIKSIWEVRDRLKATEDPPTNPFVGLAFSFGSQVIVHELRPSIRRIVEETDLHSIPSKCPAFLRGPWLIEAGRPERGEALFGETVCLGGYWQQGKFVLLGLTYPDNGKVVIWTPEWSGEDISEVIPLSTMLGMTPESVGPDHAWAYQAARFATIFALLLEAEHSPIEVTETDGKTKPKGKAKRHSGPKERVARDTWLTRYVRLTSAATGQQNGASEPSVEPSVTEGRELATVPVRGHLRRQPYGPKAELRKWVYIHGHTSRRWISPGPVRVVVS